MINIKECLSKYDIRTKKLTYLDNYVIINSDQSNYLLKMKDSDKEHLFNYLNQVRYDYFLPIENNYNDYYELYPYYKDNITDKYIKAKELIYALAILHLKTTTYVEYNHDNFKEIYEELNIRIDNTMKYYLDLQDYLEGIEFISPAQYLLLKNISSFYQLLRIAKNNLENWFSIENRNVREVLLIKNVSLNNFRVGDRSYFINYKDATKGLVVYDLISFYRKEAINVDFLSLFSFYNSKYQLAQDEVNLFFAVICIPERVVFTKNNYQDCLMVKKIVDYVLLTLSFASEKNKENEETYKD